VDLWCDINRVSNCVWCSTLGYARQHAFRISGGVTVEIRTSCSIVTPAAPLASLDRRSENIRVLAIIITELKFGNIERHIFPAHFVECADDTALEDRPEAFDGLSVDRADDILFFGMIDDRVRIVSEVLVTNPLISAKKAYFMVSVV